jgi:hypothetical protein
MGEHKQRGGEMRFAVVRIMSDGGMQAIKEHHILAARYETFEQALNAYRYAKFLYPGEYYVRCVGDKE